MFSAPPPRSLYWALGGTLPFRIRELIDHKERANCRRLSSTYLLFWIDLFLVFFTSSQVCVRFDVVLRVPRFEDCPTHSTEEAERTSFLLRLILIHTLQIVQNQNTH